MAYFAVEIREEVKRIIFVESLSDDDAGTDWDKGEEIFSRCLEREVYAIKELTPEQFEGHQIPKDLR